MSEDWEQKVWGKTRTLHQSVIYSKHELEVEVGTFCSLHYHEHRANRFEVVEGVVRVVWAYAWSLRHIDLTAGQSMRLPSLVPHQFQVLRSGKMIEEYYADRGGSVRHDDIIRISTGGIMQPQTHGADDVGIYNKYGLLWKGGPGA